MALIKCKECGAEVSSKAETCPKCGARVAAKPMGCGTLVGIILLGGIIISVFSSIFTTDTTDPVTSVQTPTTSAAAPEPNLPGSQWTYYQTDDDMGKGTVYTGHVSSTNSVEFSFPYSGEQHATLFLRTHPRWGKSLYFKIEKGQLLCNSYDGCNVLIRFDDGAAMNFSAIGPEDNGTEVLFIQNYGRFVEKMLKAKRVRIAVNIYQEGAPTFEFDVGDFDQAMYKPI